VLHDVDNKEAFEVRTLRAQKTNCTNISAQKIHDNIRVFASISNFEDALNLGKISNSNKTKVIYQVLHDPGIKDEYTNERKLIEMLYLHIIQKETAKNPLTGKFIELKCSSVYNVYFDSLIEKKSKC